MRADNETLNILLKNYDKLVLMTQDKAEFETFYRKILENTHMAIVRVLDKIE